MNCVKKESSNYPEFQNITNTESGQKFVEFIDQHREKLKDLFLLNGYVLDAEQGPQKTSVESDWLVKQVTSVTIKDKVCSIFGTVAIAGMHKIQGEDILKPSLVIFYFNKQDEHWKLVTRDGYFVNPYTSEDMTQNDVPSEIYNGINQIFPAKCMLSH